MGNNYDNWERLVTVVIRRERDKQIAMNHSRDPSTIGSTSSSSQFDSDQSLVRQQRGQLIMDYSDLTPLDHHSDQSLVRQQRGQLIMDYSDLTPLDHHQWKTMLPPDNRELVWRSASLSFSLDQWTGKNCFLLGATKLFMASGDGSKDCWENKYHPKSRFSEVAELIDSRNLYIEGDIKTKMLSPETLYAAYFVFGFKETNAKPHSAVSIIRYFYDESGFDYPDEQARIVRFRAGNGRADRWMEIELGYFYVGLQAVNGEVQVQLLDTSGYRKSGLVVEGIEFRPFKEKN